MKLYYKCKCCQKKNNLVEIILDQAWKEKDYQALFVFLNSLQENIINKERLLMTLDEFEGEKEKVPQFIQEKYTLKKEKKPTTEKTEEQEPETKSNWTNIHPDFNYRGESWETNYKEQWEQLGFTYSKCKEWIDIGLKPSESEFADWLVNAQGYDPQTVLNNYDAEQLRRDYEDSFDKEI